MQRRRAVLVAFTVKGERFKSIYERNKFFKTLYGWKQIIKKEVIAKERPKEKVYTYRREGILDDIPHIKVDQSSFIVPEDEFKKVLNFLKEWHDKVMFRTFKILLEDENIWKAFEEFEKEREVMEEEEEW
ncbi:MAG: hypothetical protein QXQ18_00545 [Candidatus Aenigmatarchaeota archaeon]